MQKGTRSMRTTLLSAVLLTWLALSGVVQAGPLPYQFEFGLAGSSPATNLVINGVGGTLDVQLYLREQAGGSTLSSEQLFSASVQVTFGTGTVAAVLSPSGITENPAFDEVLTKQTFADHAVLE